MSGIAEVLLQEGYQVTGSDIGISETTKRLEKLGAHVMKGHNANNVSGAHVVVSSTAIPSDNPEIIAAKEARISELEAQLETLEKRKSEVRIRLDALIDKLGRFS